MAHLAEAKIAVDFGLQDLDVVERHGEGNEACCYGNSAESCCNEGNEPQMLRAV